MKSHTKAWLITPQAPPPDWKGYQNISPEDHVIAVDGGYKRCLEMGFEVHYICGDMDSIDLANEEVCQSDKNAMLLEGFPQERIWRFNRDKNETDTELALLKCIELGITELIICNDMNGRTDHALGLVQNLLLAFTKRLDARIETGTQRLWFLAPVWEAKGLKGGILSLIPYSEEIRFEASTGLKWDLSGLIIKASQSRGISNEIDSDAVYVKLASGLALAVLTEIG